MVYYVCTVVTKNSYQTALSFKYCMQYAVPANENKSWLGKHQNSIVIQKNVKYPYPQVFNNFDNMIHLRSCKYKALCSLEH